jgi:hypothetical protein
LDLFGDFKGYDFIENEKTSIIMGYLVRNGLVRIENINSSKDLILVFTK